MSHITFGAAALNKVKDSNLLDFLYCGMRIQLSAKLKALIDQNEFFWN